MDNQDTEILYISFNQNNTCLALGTEKGYRIYDLQSPSHDFYERYIEGGIGLIEMLFQSNILIFVGACKIAKPDYKQNQLIVWDDCNSKIITKFSFNSYIINAKLKKDRIYVVCNQKIFIISTTEFDIIDIISFENFENTKGLIAITYEPKINLVAFPDKAIGHIRLKNYEANKTLLIFSHENAISFLTFNSKGKLLSTSALNNNFLNLYETYKGTFIYRFKYTTFTKEVLSISFDIENKFIMSSTDNGIIYVFSMKNALEKLKEIEATLSKSKHSESEYIKDNNTSQINHGNSLWSSYFKKDEGEWTKLNIPEKKSFSTFVNGTYGNNRIAAVTPNGKFYMARYDENNPGESFKEEDIYLFNYSIE